MTNNETPAVEMQMQPGEFADLRAQVALISQQDVTLGRVLDLLVLHLGHAHGLDPVQEDARLKAEALALAREEEDARLEAEAKTREEARAAEDAQPREPLQLEALKAARAAEDVQIAADAEALAKAREEEDTRLAAAKEAEAKALEEDKAAAQAAQEQAANPTTEPVPFESVDQVEAPALVVAPATEGDANAN